MDNAKIVAILDWEWAGSVPPEMELLRGFEFVKNDPDGANLWQHLIESDIWLSKLEPKQLELRFDIINLERFISRLTYLPFWVADAKQLEILMKDYVDKMKNILNKYDCLV